MTTETLKLTEFDGLLISFGLVSPVIQVSCQTSNLPRQA